MTQGSVEAILSSWLVEKQTGRLERSFSEFLDDRLRTALTFEEYSKEDRILVAKLLASRGFLTTLTAKDLGLPAMHSRVSILNSIFSKICLSFVFYF